LNIYEKVTLTYEKMELSMNHQTYKKPLFPNGFTLERLSQESLAGAIELRDEIFQEMTKEEELSLIASLDKNTYRSYYEESGIKNMEYWVLVDKKHQVIGLTGIYVEKGEINTCSLGWFCLDEHYRGRGIGEALLEFSIAQAKSLSMQFFTLYTEDSQMYHPAIALYKKYGFLEYHPSFKESKNSLHLRLQLMNSLL